MEEKEKTVLIKVKLKTRKKLLNIGKKGESYDDVISEMFKELEQRAEAPYT